MGLFGMMVGGKEEDKTSMQKTLMSISSCCPANATRVDPLHSRTILCDVKISDDCEYFMEVQDFDALASKVVDVAHDLTSFQTVSCHFSYTEVDKIPTSSLLWLLLLLVPIIFNIIWGWCLVCWAQRYYKEEEDPAPPPIELEMTESTQQLVAQDEEA